jgi:hypothetical protein
MIAISFSGTPVMPEMAKQRRSPHTIYFKRDGIECFRDPEPPQCSEESKHNWAQHELVPRTVVVREKWRIPEWIYVCTLCGAYMKLFYDGNLRRCKTYLPPDKESLNYVDLLRRYPTSLHLKAGAG